MVATLPVSYSAVSEVYRTVPEISSASAISSADVAGFIGDAEALINAHIAKQYSLPVGTDIPMLTTLSTNIALYYIIARRLYAPKKLADSPWPDRFKEAIDTLKEIGAGTLPLTLLDGSVLATRSDIGEAFSTSEDYLPTFHEGGNLTHVIDPDKVDDLLSDRDFGVANKLLN